MNLRAARTALESAKLCGSSFVGTSGHLQECDRYGMPPEQVAKAGEEVTYCTCVMGAMRGAMAFVDQAIAAIDGAVGGGAT